VDESARTTRTHPRFQTHAYTSTCGNGVHDAGEYCDDGNQNDGDGCSSACSLEAGWVCETVSLQSPSICRKGLVGQRVPDQEVGCKAYACEPPKLNTAGNTGPTITQQNIDDWLATAAGQTIICSGTTTDATQKFYPGDVATSDSPVFAAEAIGTQVPGTHGDSGSNEILLGGSATTVAGDYVGATLRVIVGGDVDIYTITGYTAGKVATVSPSLVKTYVHTTPTTYEIMPTIPYGPNYPVCKLHASNVQGTCSLCINWDSSDATPSSNADPSGVKGGILGSSGVAGFDGSSKRRLLVDDSSFEPAAPVPASSLAKDAVSAGDEAANTVTV